MAPNLTEIYLYSEYLDPHDGITSIKVRDGSMDWGLRTAVFEKYTAQFNNNNVYLQALKFFLLPDGLDIEPRETLKLRKRGLTEGGQLVAMTNEDRVRQLEEDRIYYFLEIMAGSHKSPSDEQPSQLVGLQALYNFWWGHEIPTVGSIVNLNPDDKTFSEWVLEDTGGRFLVRKEYHEMFDRLVTAFKDGDGKLPGGIVVTGQPGIGKSWWTWYTLIRHLCQRLPVALYQVGQLYVFSEDGRVQQLTLMNAPFSRKTWALFDSDGKVNEPPEELWRKFWLVQVSSPNPDRYKHWTKYRGGCILVMNPWTENELIQGLPLHVECEDETDKTRLIDRLKAIVLEHGPLPRDVYRILKRPEYDSQRRAAIETALNKLDPASFLRSLETIEAKTHEVSHPLIMIKRADVPVTSVDDTILVEFRSSNIAAQVQTMLKKMELSSIENILSQCRIAPETTVFGGWLFESWAGRILSVQHPAYPSLPALVAMPRIRSRRVQSATSTSRRLAYSPSDLETGTLVWPTSVVEDDSSVTDDVAINTSPTESKLNTHARTVVYYNDVSEVEWRKDRYYIPAARNNPLFDSFFFDSDKDNSEGKVTMWIFQLTVGNLHGGLANGYDEIRSIADKILGITRPDGVSKRRRLNYDDIRSKIWFNFIIVCPMHPIRRVLWDIPVDKKDKTPETPSEEDEHRVWMEFHGQRANTAIFFQQIPLPMNHWATKTENLSATA